MSGHPKNQQLPAAPPGEEWRIVTHQFAITERLLCASGDIVPLGATTWSWDEAEGEHRNRIAAPMRWLIPRFIRRRIETAELVRFLHVKVDSDGRSWGDRVVVANERVRQAVIDDLRAAQESAARQAGRLT